jgi:hypothetical protein
MKEIWRFTQFSLFFMSLTIKRSTLVERHHLVFMRILRDVKGGVFWTNVSGTPKIESSPFHLKISIKEEWTTLREIQTNSRMVFFFTFVSSKKQHKLSECIPLSYDLQLFWGLKNEKHTINCSNSENFVKTWQSLITTAQKQLIYNY